MIGLIEREDRVLFHGGRVGDFDNGGVGALVLDDPIQLILLSGRQPAAQIRIVYVKERHDRQRIRVFCPGR